jgi:hypothetical protein
MTGRVLPLAALLFLTGVPTAAPPELRGWASAYAPGRMEEVVRYRLDNNLWRNPLPRDWYTVPGYVATNDCAQVGQVLTLVTADGREWPVLVADCGGAGDGIGSDWMTKYGIVAELDWRLWTKLTEIHGRPLEISLW